MPSFVPLLVAAALAVGLATSAWADSYRCGRKLIRTGDRPADVLRICGEPAARDRGVEALPGSSGGRARVERWYYRQGSRSLQRIVLIHEGRVVAIRKGRR